MMITHTVKKRSLRALATLAVVTTGLVHFAYAENGTANAGANELQGNGAAVDLSRCLQWSDGCNRCGRREWESVESARCTKMACVNRDGQPFQRQDRCMVSMDPGFVPPKNKRQVCRYLKKRVRSATRARDLASTDFKRAAGQYLGCLSNLEDGPDIQPLGDTKQDGSSAQQLSPPAKHDEKLTCVVSASDSNRCGASKRRRQSKGGQFAELKVVTSPELTQKKMDAAGEKLNRAEEELMLAQWDHKRDCLGLSEELQDAHPAEPAIATPTNGSSSSAR